MLRKHKEKLIARAIFISTSQHQSRHKQAILLRETGKEFYVLLGTFHTFQNQEFFKFLHINLQFRVRKCKLAGGNKKNS